MLPILRSLASLLFGYRSSVLSFPASLLIIVLCFTGCTGTKAELHGEWKILGVIPTDSLSLLGKAALNVANLYESGAREVYEDGGKYSKYSKEGTLQSKGKYWFEDDALVRATDSLHERYTIEFKEDSAILIYSRETLSTKGIKGYKMLRQR